MTSFKFSARGWRIKGTGATLLGNVLDHPVIDFTDSRFGTLGYLQIIGSSLNRPSCGIRIGRNADNDAANQMTMDHVGVRGHYGIAALLNVASEQHTSVACEYYNETEGSVYGYFADAFNCAQWGRPLAIKSWTQVGTNNYRIETYSNHGLITNDKILIRGQMPSNAGIDATLLTVEKLTDTTFKVNAGKLGSFSGGQLYKQLYPDVDTPGLSPWTQASMKQQLHLNCRYGAAKGIAAIFEGADSMHVFQACHPTSGYYTVGSQVAIQDFSLGATTTVTTQTSLGLMVGNLVSLTGLGMKTGGPSPVPTPFATFAGDRLFMVASVSGSAFELRDLKNGPVDSTGWGAKPGDLGTAARQMVAGGDDPYAGGFGMRMVVGQATGCDVSDYFLHHEGGTSDGTTWWASIESMEGLRDGAPGPVTLTDVTFREPAASGRGGFLLAQRATVSAVTMVGGKVAVAHPHREFGNLSQANRVLTATGTGASPWTLTGTELVLEDAALVDAGRLAGFTGRVSTGGLGYTAGLAVAYPGTLAALGALRPDSRNFTSFVRRYDALLRTLDDAGVLAKLDALHVFATGNEAAARVNLAEPAARTRSAPSCSAAG